VEEFFIVFGSFCMSLGSYFVWPAKRNILAHLQLGLFLVAFVVPVFLTNTLSFFSPELKLQYSLITFLGGLAFLVGIIIGFKIKPRFGNISLITFFKNENNNVNFLTNRLAYISIGAVIILFISFALIGFVPAFSDDPFQAKFFRGAYKEAYQPYAIPYRISYTILTSSIAFTFATYIHTKKRLFIVLSVIIAFALLLTLNRGAIVAGLLLTGCCYACLNKRWFWPFFVFIVFVFPLGSASYYLLGLITGNSTFLQLYNTSSVWSIIANGAPDVPDQLNFLNSFNNVGQLTYGKTFLGGLVPSNYIWNPSVYTLYIINNGQADINSINSGGLRLSVAMWGYTAFGWFGVAILPLLSGLLWGMSTRYIKTLSYKHGTKVLSLVVIVVIYNSIYKSIAEFYIFSMYSVISLFFILYIVFGRYVIFVKKTEKTAGVARDLR